MHLPPLRVIHDGPQTGPVNMARDEALLLRVGRGESPPTLRFYEWKPPTISLGYFQQYREYETLPLPAGGLAVVRRTTGGGAILHDRELTYSITLPSDHGLLANGPNRIYELMHDTLIAVLDSIGLAANRKGSSDGSGAAKGPFFCFARRHCLDVLTASGADKIAGSAQRRTKHAILQHGSIVLQRRFEQQPAAAIVDHVPMTAETLARGLAAAVSTIACIACVGGAWRAEELADAEPLIDKYAGDAWTRRT